MKRMYKLKQNTDRLVIKCQTNLMLLTREDAKYFQKICSNEN